MRYTHYVLVNNIRGKQNFPRNEIMRPFSKVQTTVGLPKSFNTVSNEMLLRRVDMSRNKFHCIAQQRNFGSKI